MEDMIVINHLKKKFGEVIAVDDLSFKVKTGEFFAFLGINGAGKSTTISIMTNLIKRDSGDIFIDGMNIDDSMDLIKGLIGVVYQNNVLDKALSVYDNLKYRAGLYNIYGKEFEDRYNELAKMLDFEYLKKRTYSKLSGGEKRRVDIARALFHRPKLLILDEPTTGLDPKTRKLVWQVIDNLRKTINLTVFLTTHYMEEVSDADYVVILNKGKINACGTPLELKNKYTGDFINLYNVSLEEVQKLGLKFIEIQNGYRIEVPNTMIATKLIIENPKLFNDYEIIKGKMDDVFLNATGINLMGE